MSCATNGKQVADLPRLFGRSATCPTILACLAGLVAGCGHSGSDSATTQSRATAPLPPDKNQATHDNLRKIGEGYHQAVDRGNPVTGPRSLGANAQSALKSPRDDRPFRIVWSFKQLDPTIPSGTRVLLAWEQSADTKGGRFVLLADFATIEYLYDADFKKSIEAKPSK